jgi:hypothetical protein
MAVAINTVALEIAQKVNDDKTSANAVHTAGTEDGQRFTASARRTYINNANIEMYNIFRKLAENYKDESDAIQLLTAYCTGVSQASGGYPTQYDFVTAGYEDVIAVSEIFEDGLTNFDVFLRYYSPEKARTVVVYTGQELWTKAKGVVNIFAQQLNITVITFFGYFRIFAVKPPVAVGAGSNLTIKDSHKDLLEAIVLKNMFLDLYELDKVQIYNESIKSKLISVLKDF